jgi:hypothetical protein
MENEIEINGKKYVLKDSIKQQPVMASKEKDMEYAIVRTYSAGVLAGYIASEKGQEVEIHEARRLWYWSGAASLSQLAMEGVKKPQDCKFPCPVAKVRVKQAIEILPCTEVAKKSIEGVAIWKC